jgi:xanthine dehydrogenase accessory factor
MSDLLDRVTALRREGQSFAVATVVARRSPVSAHLGDRAIIFPDGRMEGFVGGACSCDIVRHEALEALRTRRSRLVSIRPDATDSTEITPEHIVVSMKCESEGAVEVFVEPFVQVRRLVVVGATPVADALVRVGRSLDYEVVWAVDSDARHDVGPRASAAGATVVVLGELDGVLSISGSDVAAVVASQGHDDDLALETILKRGVSYVGLVASRKRGAAIRASLGERGVPGIETIRSPAGLDLGARVPAEVALSVLAEIVKLSPSLSPAYGATCGAQEAAAVSTANAAPADPPAAPRAYAIDPVCGMKIEIGSTRHTAELDGVTYYFCCSHCRGDFVAEPQQFLLRQS